jgi:hypothetical protein
MRKFTMDGPSRRQEKEKEKEQEQEQEQVGGSR